jgi:IstB-like ATP binding protein
VTSTKTAPGRDVTAELAFLARALKAPTLRDAVPRLAERARTGSWTHEEFLAACLQREVSARESHGGEGRIRAARFPARKALELSGVSTCRAAFLLVATLPRCQQGAGRRSWRGALTGLPGSLGCDVR